ncbi:hypothetical protein ACVBEH_11080 [Roseateles sp. GG27B]
MRLQFGQFALELHEGKTRLMEFGRFAASSKKRCSLGKPESGTFLRFIFNRGDFAASNVGRSSSSKDTGRPDEGQAPGSQNEAPRTTACTTPFLNKADG